MRPSHTHTRTQAHSLIFLAHSATACVLRGCIERRAYAGGPLTHPRLSATVAVAVTCVHCIALLCTQNLDVAGRGEEPAIHSRMHHRFLPRLL